MTSSLADSRDKLPPTLSETKDKGTLPDTGTDTDEAKNVGAKDNLQDGSTDSDEVADGREEAGTSEDGELDGTTIDDVPPLPDEAPPLPEQAPPEVVEEDDGWAPVWEAAAQAFYFYNRFTGASQWTNPRVPDPPVPAAPGVQSTPADVSSTLPNDPPPPSDDVSMAGGYNPAIHGDYDPNAWYAQPATAHEPEASTLPSTEPSSQYAATAAFNRFTGRFQNSDLNPENFNDENKSKRQMNAFFDVDAAANSHDGRSLKAERSGKKLSKTELKQFKEKRKAKKEEKRRAWLRD